MVLRQGVVPQGVLRRALMLFMVLGLAVLVLHRSGTAVCFISLISTLQLKEGLRENNQ